MLKYYISSSLARNLTTYRVLFRIPPSSKIISLSDCTWIVTLLPRPSIHLNNPWLGWKAIYFETLYIEFFSAKSDNVSSTFFVYHLGQKLFHSQTVLGQWHSSLDSQFIWISSWLGWKAVYVETLYASFLARNLTTYRVLFSYTT